MQSISIKKPKLDYYSAEALKSLRTNLLFCGEDKKVIVLPTKTVPQGITALINFMPDSSPEENEAVITEEIKHVKTGQVTYAVRDTMIDDKEIQKDDFMGIGDKGLLSVGKDVQSVTMDMVGAMTDDSSELISIYYGSEIEEAAAQEICDQIKSSYPSCDVELQYGGQPIYYYVVSVE